MGWRRIIIESRPFEYWIKPGSVIFTLPNGKKHYVGCHTIMGCTPDDWDRAQYKRYGAMTPKHIREYILKELWDYNEYSV